MTIVFTIASSHLIAMAADSAVTIELEDSREYEVGRKSYFFEGVGCLTTWGARDHNRIGPFLQDQGVTHHSHSVFELADFAQEFLEHHYRPSDLGLEDVGYHVAGFDPKGDPHLWHIFYGFDRPRPPGQTAPAYRRYDHTPPRGAAAFLYKGRNDLAEPVVRTLIGVLNSGQPSNFDLGSPVDVARFADLVPRFAAEFTPEVGPPFITHLFSPGNRGLHIVNKGLSPLPRPRILDALRTIGYDGP